MPRTTGEVVRIHKAAPRNRRVLTAGLTVLLIGGATTACAVVGLDPTGPLADPVDPPAAAATTKPGDGNEAASPSDTSYTQVPLPQGVSMWHQPLPDGTTVYFVAERNGDDIVTSRVGMGGPRCFFGVAQDGVLQGRYRVITAGSGLDRQADPVRVKAEGDSLTLTERATGTTIGEYVRIDPADVEAVAAAQAALDACDAVRDAPATATPR